MKIICIVGSPHGVSGNTFRLAEWTLAAAAQAGAELEIVLLDGLVLPCRGCDTCHREGQCPQDDNFEAVRRAIEAADALLLLSPNYLGSVSAQMKAFMDRCSGAIHRMALQGRYGASVVTSGGEDNEAVAGYMNRFLLMTGIQPIGSVSATMACMPNGEFTSAVREQARDLGERLMAAWQDKFSDPETEAEIKSIRDRMRQLIVWKKEEWPYEYGYWQEHHGLA
jgi:multimeric flavodoxin WrbA